MRERPTRRHAAALALSIGSIFAASTATAVSPAEWRDTFMVDDGEYDIRLDPAASQRLVELGAKRASAPQAPEVFDVPRHAKNLSLGPGGDRVAVARAFLVANRAQYQLTESEIESLVVVADDHGPERELSFVRFAQHVDDLPVFAAEIVVAFAADGRVFRTVGRIVADVARDAKSTDFGDVQHAIATAGRALGHSMPKHLRETGMQHDGRVRVFERSGFASPVTAEPMWFPLANGVVRPVWRVMLMEPVLGFYVIVDAGTGEMLWRTNLTRFQSQAATYGVYAGANPAPIYPGPPSPEGQQAPLVNRVAFTKIGNESPYTFNNLGWITDGGISTVGNAVAAGIDRDGVEGIDTAGSPANPFRQFSYSYNPAPGAPAPGADPLAGAPPLTNYQAGVITHAFYWANVFHDEMYRYGFTEAARNHQADNFSRGGVANDRLSVEVQDSSAINNAFSTTLADGSGSRVQMHVWTGGTPDRDGALDTTILLHELTHTMTLRIVGNASAPATDASRAITEGWADFVPGALLAQPADSLDARYTIGSYAIYQLNTVGANNNYYGIRRFPIARLTSTGGPADRPHNPLTFKDVDPLQLDVSDGAFPPNPGFPGGTSVFARGELWAAVLWEVRQRLVERLGADTGGRRALQLVIDGMKLTPNTPTFLGARDAIIAAASASADPRDVVDAWAGFSRRGMGPGATEAGNIISEPLLSDGFE